MDESAILKKLAHQPKKSAGFKQLARELGARGPQRRQLEETLRRMVSRKQLLERDGLYVLPAAAMPERLPKNMAAGRLSLHRDGYGFVIPQERALREKLDGDIFIPPPAIGSAMHGDLVLVEMSPPRGLGRVEGRIERVLDRAHTTVVGIFRYGTRQNYVIPIDERVGQDIIIPRGMEVPPSREPEPADEPAPKKARKGSPHRVLGEEVRRRAEFRDLEGLVVDVEITDWPTPTQPARGRVVEVLGNEDDFGVDVEIIIRKHHIPHVFPAPVLEEAQRTPFAIPQSELRRRADYRKTPIVTIDGETARDFDDAVHVSRRENGNYELQVHIADVAHYVHPGSAIEAEARLRGTSVYFPDRAVPMLPLELSTDVCSLRPQVERLVLSCVMEIDRQGEIAGYELHQGVIRSFERMTYTDVHQIISGDSGLRQRYSALVPMFDEMYELAQILNRKRVRRGSIDFDLPEPIIEFDEEGLMTGVRKAPRNWAHRLIEEFMLAANECVATYLEEKGIASLYRIHEKPEPKKVYDFETLAASFGYSLGVGALPIERLQMKTDRRARYGTGRRAPTVELPKEVQITPVMYQKLANKIAGKPEERILSFLMLRSLKQARYSEQNEGHFALAAPTYTHFTSPIRRYPDLIVHRILKEVLQGNAEEEVEGVPTGVGRQAGHSQAASPWSKRGARKLRAEEEERRRASAEGPISEDELRDIGESSSQTERRADEAERELMEWKKLKFMQDRVGEEFDALIISVTKFGFFVELLDMFIEGLVPLDSLDDDYYTYRESTKQIVGQRGKKTFSLGDRVRVLLDRIDRMQKKINFAVVEEQPSRAQRRHRKRS